LTGSLESGYDAARRSAVDSLERLFGFSPDGGTDAVEALMVGLPIVAMLRVDELSRHRLGGRAEDQGSP